MKTCKELKDILDEYNCLKTIYVYDEYTLDEARVVSIPKTKL